MSTNGEGEYYLKRELYELVRSDESIFEFLQSGSLDGIWYWDVTEPEQEWLSPRFKELFGYADDEIPNTSAWWQENIFPDDLEPTLKNFEAHLSDPDHPYDQVVRYRHRDGSTVWVRCRGMAIRDADGKPLRMLGAHTDVTELMQARIDLEETRARFVKLFEDAPIGMGLVDLDGTFISANQAYCEIVGREREEMEGMTFQEITHPDDLDTDVGYVEALLAGEIPSYEMEKRYLRPGGESIWVQLNASLIRDPEGQPVHFIAQVQDISERKRVLAELERSNAELARFAHVASHDLREPLIVVDGFAEMLERSADDRLDKREHRFIANIRRGVDRMQRLIDGLLAFARADAAELMLEPIDCEEIVDEVLESIAATLEEAGAGVQVGDLPEVRAGRIPMTQLFQNLLANAARYSETDTPRIAVEATREPGGWRFSVSDNGPGIPADHRDEIFEMFGRLHDASVSGAGIGLATCRRIVERRGGHIWVEDAPGGGARFVFTVPDRVPRGPAPDPPVPADHAAAEPPAS